MYLAVLESPPDLVPFYNPSLNSLWLPSIHTATSQAAPQSNSRIVLSASRRYSWRTRSTPQLDKIAAAILSAQCEKDG